MTQLWSSSKFAKLYKLSLCNCRANEASDIYIYRYMRHTLVARACSYVMWEELSFSHF